MRLTPAAGGHAHAGDTRGPRANDGGGRRSAWRSGFFNRTSSHYGRSALDYRKPADLRPTEPPPPISTGLQAIDSEDTDEGYAARAKPSPRSGGKHCELNIGQEDLQVIYVWVLPE
jgi:hypothetical protein